MKSVRFSGRAPIAWAIALSLSSLAAKAEAGNVLISGREMNSTIQGYLTTLGNTSTIVAPASLSGTSFAGYSAIWLGTDTTYAGLASRQADFLSFLNAGGNVLIEYGLGTDNPIADYPMGSSLTPVVSNTDTVRIIAPGDPLNAGLTDAGLSNWGNSIHSYFSSIDGFTGVTTDGTDGHFVTIEKAVGLGHLIYTGQDIAFHIKFGSGPIGAASPKGVFLNNALSFAPSAAVPEPGSITLLGLGLAALGLTARRHRLRKSA